MEVALIGLQQHRLLETATNDSIHMQAQNIKQLQTI